MPSFVEVAQQAAHAGGDILMQYLGRIKAKEKGPKDLVTEADVASQKKIEEILLGAFPEHRFLGEEDTGKQQGGQSEYQWIVDPLDGTVNFVHGLPQFSVSIALVSPAGAVVGVVYDPILKECYVAETGKGATLNGEPIEVSDTTELQNCLAAASFSTGVHRGSPEIDRFVEVLVETRAVRRLGSAALNLCYVASGRLDAYWATGVKIWDVAAGMLILHEAGGYVTHISGAPFDPQNPKFAAAANPQLHSKFLELLHRAKCDD